MRFSWAQRKGWERITKGRKIDYGGTREHGKKIMLQEGKGFIPSINIDGLLV
jgi:hypothetical protein